MLLSKTRYVLVDGFYPATNGISPSGKFHGAKFVNGKYYRVMVDSDSALAVSEVASASKVLVSPRCLLETSSGTGAMPAVAKNKLGHDEAQSDDEQTLNEIGDDPVEESAASFAVMIEDKCPECGCEFRAAADGPHCCPECDMGN